MAVLTQVTLPILFVVFLGYLLRKIGRVEESVLSRIQLYVLSPALIFMTMAGSNAMMSLLGKIFLHVVILSVLLYLSAQLLGRMMRGDALERNAMSLAAVFTNSGFYGIPVCMLAFGEEGLGYAAMYVICSSMIQSTAGIYIASEGSRKPLEALAMIFKVPLIYAIVLGKLLSQFDMLPPAPFMEMINMLGRAAVPLGLLLLGMQLERIISDWRLKGIANGAGRGWLYRKEAACGRDSGEPRRGGGTFVVRGRVRPARQELHSRGNDRGDAQDRRRIRIRDDNTPFHRVRAGSSQGHHTGILDADRGQRRRLRDGVRMPPEARYDRDHDGHARERRERGASSRLAGALAFAA